MTSSDRLARMLSGEAVDRLLCMPILMIWAAQDAGVSYADYVRDYRVLGDCQVRLLEQFPLDVAQLISDPYRETADAGAELQYYDDGPPRCLRPLLRERAALATLQTPDPLAGGRMTDRVQGAAYLKAHLGADVPIMGWVEGPIALAVDLRGMTELMLDLVDDRAFVRDLCDWATDLEIAFARAQVEAGCSIIGIGDAAASLVSAADYRELVLPGEQRLVQAIHQAGATARLHICGNTTHLLSLMPLTGCDIIDLDHLVPIEQARGAMGDDVAILGNFDPVAALLRATPEEVKVWCRRCHEACGVRHIIGPGCEVPPGTPRANIMAMCEYAREASLPRG